MVLTAVAGYSVQKDETTVYLVFVQGGTGAGNIVGYTDVDRIWSTRFIREIIPKHTRVTSTSRLRQLEFSEKPVALRCRFNPENHRYRYHQRTVNDRGAG